jgi:ABC-type glycerol-3-phosphate transport system substrate-binding protein
MKKLIALALTGIVGFTACGGSDESEESLSNPQTFANDYWSDTPVENQEDLCDYWEKYGTEEVVTSFQNNNDMTIEQATAVINVFKKEC